MSTVPNYGEINASYIISLLNFNSVACNLRVIKLRKLPIHFTLIVGLGDIEFLTCDYCMNYLLRLLQYCMQKIITQPQLFSLSAKKLRF